MQSTLHPKYQNTGQANFLGDVNKMPVVEGQENAGQEPRIGATHATVQLAGLICMGLASHVLKH